LKIVNFKMEKVKFSDTDFSLSVNPKKTQL